jgi:hypothetical protein
MGVVIPFPSGLSRRRTPRHGRWAVVGVLVASLSLVGVVLAGRDLLRDAQAGQGAASKGVAGLQFKSSGPR